MALYVLPRAVRACLSSAWLRGGRSVKVVERYASTLKSQFPPYSPTLSKALSRGSSILLSTQNEST